MQHSIGTWIMWAGMAGWILWALAMGWPARRRRQFTLQAVIAAPAERIWNAHCTHLHDPASAPLNAGIVSATRVQDHPPTYEYVVDSTGGFNTHHTTLRYEILSHRENESDSARIVLCDGKPFPFGPDHVETLALQRQNDRTSVTLSWQGETATLGQFRGIRRAYQHYLGRVQTFCETGEVLPVRPRRSPRFNLILSALAVGTFALWLGWIGAAMLTAVLILHEFGHLVAMRLTGQPAPRMMLLPFFGGVALANHPHKTLFNDAFCALMGPGLSALASLVFVLAAQVIDARPGAGSAAIGMTSDQLRLATWFMKLGLMLGVLNLLQLVPLLPLDGGQVLRAVMQSLHASWARRVMIGFGGLGAGAFALAGDPLLAGVVLFGGVQAWHMSGAPPRARPMRGFAIAVIAIGYALTIALHGAAVMTALSWLRIG
jgi:Zn-dependent protease